ncbi:MAG: late competence development ComFB family protein [Spirochaetaceae bacterium]|jgi:competence protein ComFB|nr:late competence development ComFB family protein [Spirochaetaceae bacterium]
MKIRNLMEDIVLVEVESVCKDIKNNPAYEDLCVCDQCRLDAVCYVLNRVSPRYFASSRGLAREEIFSFEKQQKDADLIALIFEAFKTVAHNKRPNRSHRSEETHNGGLTRANAVFNIPVIMGCILNGQNFAPMTGVNVELYIENELVKMNNENWQNPYFLSDKTNGAFTFWPESISSKEKGEQKTVSFSICVQADNFEPLRHFFELTVTSEPDIIESISMGNTLKIPNLYMFPPEKK